MEMFQMSVMAPRRLSLLLLSSSSSRWSSSSRSCSTLGALQTLRVKNKIEEKRAEALMGGKLSSGNNAKCFI